MSKKRPVIFLLLQLWTIVGLLSSAWRSSSVSAEFGDEDESNFNRTFFNNAPFVEHNQDDWTLDVGSNFSLVCKDKVQVTWKVPEVVSGAVEVVAEESFDSAYPFASRLTINSADHTFVGFYYCVQVEEEGKANMEELVATFKATPFYIFVDDPDNVFVDTVHVIQGTEGETVIIPCKPTSKYVSVELLKEDEEFALFDYRRGFLVNAKKLFYRVKCVFAYSDGPLVEEEKILKLQPASSTTLPASSSPTANLTATEQTRLYYFNSNGKEGVNVPSRRNSTGSRERATTAAYDFLDMRTNSVVFKIPPRPSSHPPPPPRGSPRSGAVSGGPLASDNKTMEGRVNVMWKFLKAENKPMTMLMVPQIQSNDNFHVFEGHDLYLNCTLEIDLAQRAALSWELPSQDQAVKENRVEVNYKSIPHPTHKNKLLLMSLLRVSRVNNETDRGYYKCIATDSTRKTNTRRVVNVIDQANGFINIKEVTGSYQVTTKANARIQWLLDYNAFPPAIVSLFDNHGKEISTENDQKYNFTVDGNHIFFIIKHGELKDAGIYTLKADNYVDNKEVKLELIVEDKPTVLMEDYYIMDNTEASLVCKSAGYPESVITWSYTPCSIFPRWPTCDEAKSFAFDHSQYETVKITEQSQTSTLKFHFPGPGKVFCIADNSLGSDKATSQLTIGDLTEDLQVWGIEADNPISMNDVVELSCGALVYNFTGPLHWYKDNVLVEEDLDNGVEVIENNTKYSYRKIIHLASARKEDSGTYDCRAEEMESQEIRQAQLHLTVNDALAPHLDVSNVNEEPTVVDLGGTTEFRCVFSGIPRPVVKWYKDEELIVDDSASNPNTTIRLFDGDTMLYIKYTKPEHQGVYKCVGENKVGIVTRSTQLELSGIPRISKYLLWGIPAVVLGLLLAFLILCFRYRKTRRTLKELKEAGLANFEEGSPECINPAMALDEQADLLPYNKDFEFPREDLKLGKQLGAGAFGIVVKAIAKGIVHYEEESTVAVKMVKPNADNEVMRALISELKIMVHLGQHVNVVNLLGAVTKDIAKRKVMVIVEYCRYGNVQNFLQKNREEFIDQINPETGVIDPTILSKEQRWSNDSGYEYNRRLSQRQSGNQAYIQKSVMNRQTGNAGGGSGTGGGYDAMDSCNTEATLLSDYVGDDEMVMTNNTVGPAWRSNYKMDYKGPVPTVTTSTLVGWGFQVARAMEYLSSRNILHGDLAARNVLLCDDNVVKVCDFGLARTMYNSNNYKKKGEAPLPFKWLALESLTDHVFSTHSDIWSYGIVMWEFFSLAKVPYPGMNADENLYMKLRDGYRMEKPKYANQEIHDIMLECWRASPETRPSFAELEKRLGDMLQDTVKDHYLDLNEPYLQMNTEYMRTGKRDYFSSMGPPETPAPPVPTYVNTKGGEEGGSPDTSYLKMSPNTGKVFYDNSNNEIDARQLNQIHLSDAMFKKSPPANNFDKKTGAAGRQSKKPEEMPMLKHINELVSSDSETEAANGDSSKNGIALTSLNADNRNYVNVPSTMGQGEKQQPVDVERGFSPKDAFSNPTYLGLKSYSDKHKA